MEGPVPIVQMKKQVGEVKGFALGRQDLWDLIISSGCFIKKVSEQLAEVRHLALD